MTQCITCGSENVESIDPLLTSDKVAYACKERPDECPIFQA